VSVDLTVRIGDLTLPNPVLLASGCCGYGDELSRFVDLHDVGGLMVKGTTLEPREGNPPPRIAETPSGMLNSIGLQNPGVDRVIAEKLPWLRKLGVPVIVNVSGNTPDDYVECARRLADAPDAHAIELNVSCPNVKHGGIQFGVDPRALESLTRAVRDVFPRALIVKLTPNVTDITELARAAVAGGADALSAINTLVGMSIDIATRRPTLHRTMGGLSGPAIRPVAVRCTWQVSRAVDVPVIGMGGITNADDAIEFLLAGASAVAIGTANLVDPGVHRTVLQGIQSYCENCGVDSLAEIIGTVRSWDNAL
jgi:dihydroorotate dehydrogenase (NAD+) catalytic subunit